jgi:hypothetical protein
MLRALTEAERPAATVFYDEKPGNPAIAAHGAGFAAPIG